MNVTVPDPRLQIGDRRIYIIFNFHQPHGAAVSAVRAEWERHLVQVALPLWERLASLAHPLQHYVTYTGDREKKYIYIFIFGYSAGEIEAWRKCVWTG